ncbi:MAG: hypothetical protein PGN13_03880 [Patulibacter minatonensis]
MRRSGSLSPLKHLVLDLVDVVLEAEGDGLVAVDDGIERGVQHGARALLQLVGAALELLQEVRQLEEPALAEQGRRSRCP